MEAQLQHPPGHYMGKIMIVLVPYDVTLNEHEEKFFIYMLCISNSII